MYPRRVIINRFEQHPLQKMRAEVVAAAAVATEKN